MPIIKSIRAFPLSITYNDDPSSEFSEAWGVQLFIKANIDEYAGWGEVLVYGSGVINAYLGVINDILIHVVNGIEVNDINDIRTMVEKLDKILFTGGLCGIINGAIGGIEMAILDAYARYKGNSLSELIGTRARNSVPVYASFPRYSSISDILTAVNHALERGHKAIKLHQPFTNVMESIRAVRDKYGYDIGIAIDLNAPFKDVDKAIELINKLHKYEPMWVEEPMWPPNDYDTIAELASKSPVPIAIGENEYSAYGFKKIINAGVKYIQPDISKVGGVFKFMDIVKIIKKHGIPVAPHHRPHRSILAHAFTLSVASIEDGVSIIEWPLALPPRDLFLESIEIRNGNALIPSRPGVGVSITEERLESYKYRSALRVLPFSDLNNH